jgi:regulator of replication initiation timing
VNELIKQIKGRDERLLQLEEENGKLRTDKSKFEKRLDDLTKEKLVIEQRGYKQV